MSLARFEDFYFAACLADEPDSVGAWAKASEECGRLAEWIQGHEEVRVTAPGTDIRLGIAGRKFIAADGKRNMPDGEFFTAPIEDSVDGEVSVPPAGDGRRSRGGRGAPSLRRRQGRRRERRAGRGVPDQPARHRRRAPGASASSGSAPTTRSIAAPANVLLDEKIGGTVHMAVGASYPECGGDNQSAVHTDLVCDLRRGGRIEVDGEPFQEDGRFLV